MTTFNYGSKNGVASVIKFVQQVCRIYGIFQAPIIAYIDGSSLSTEDKTTVKAWLNGATAACGILMSIKVTYEA